MKNIRQPSVQQKLAVPHREDYEFVEVNQIIYCEADGAYTKIHLEDKRNVLVSKTLGDISELLPDDMFQRIHHSSLVNMGYIFHFIRSDGGYIILKNG